MDNPTLLLCSLPPLPTFLRLCPLDSQCQSPPDLCVCRALGLSALARAQRVIRAQDEAWAQALLTLHIAAAALL